MNLGGPELLILFSPWLIGVVIVIVIARRDPSTSMKDATATVPDSGQSWMQRVSLELSGLPGHTVSYMGPLTMQVRVTRHPGWAYALAVLFFPIGLVALVASTAEDGTIAVVEDGATSKVRLRGLFSAEAIEAINRVIP